MATLNRFYCSGISGMSLSNFPSDTHKNYKVNFQIYFEPFLCNKPYRFKHPKLITILAIISVFSRDLVGIGIGDYSQCPKKQLALGRLSLLYTTCYKGQNPMCWFKS